MSQYLSTAWAVNWVLPRSKSVAITSLQVLIAKISLSAEKVEKITGILDVGGGGATALLILTITGSGISAYENGAKFSRFFAEQARHPSSVVREVAGSEVRGTRETPRWRSE